MCFVFFFSSRRRHTRFDCDWSSDVCSSDLNAYTEANDFFVKNAQEASCLAKGYNLNTYQCNKAPKLIRNIFGGSLGGPIKKDRAYLFMNYEGTRRAEATSETVAVPSAAMKDGVMQ